jgi:hypothetical protein
MVSRFRQRRRSSGNSAWLYVAGGALIVAVLAAIAVIFYVDVTEPRAPTLVKDTLCPVDGPRGTTVVLIDASDDLPEIGKREVTRLLLDIAESLPAYYRLELRTLDSAVPAGHVLFSKCNPGDGANLSELTANPQLARKRWKDGFQGPVDAALERSLSSARAVASPIMSTIQQIAVDRFTGHAADNQPKALIIVSDMIENTPDYSQYSGDLSFDRFRRSKGYAKYRTDLEQADVTIHYVQRQTRRPLDATDLMRFWLEWVKDNNGHFDQAIRLQGLG